MLILNNLLKTLTLIAAILLVSLSQISANEKIYIPETSLLKEIQENYERYQISPNATTTFDLAMSYAYTGHIEKGWARLKTIPNFDNNYAPKVLKKYTTLIKKNPKEWKYHFKIAFGHYFKKDKKKAIASFEEVLKIDKDHIWAMGFIALIKGEINEVDSAISYCQKALEIEPNATAIHFLIAEAYRRKEDYYQSFKHVLKVGRLKALEQLSPVYKNVP